MTSLKSLITTGILSGSLVFGGCESDDNKKVQENNVQEIKEIDTNSLIKYSLKYIKLELIKDGKEMDSLDNYYDSLDKRTDIALDSLKKITYRKVIKKSKPRLEYSDSDSISTPSY